MSKLCHRFGLVVLNELQRMTLGYMLEWATTSERTEHLIFGEWFRVELLSNIQETVHVVRCSSRVHRSTINCIGLDIGY